MYPNRDFRYLVNQSDVPECTLIRSLARESIPEILRYWTNTQKPDHLLQIYCQGIEDAIARDRYPLYQLESIRSYPEFWNSLLNGLKRLWLSLRFSLDSKNLLIDSINGQNIDISPQDKLQILQILPDQVNLTLIVDGQPQTMGIVISPRAEQIYNLVHSFY